MSQTTDTTNAAFSEAVVSASPNRQEPARRAIRMHGGVRGENLTRNSPLFEGRFGRMFRTLPHARFAEADLKALARAMTAEAEAVQTPETEPDAEENSGIRAGYTYLGQFLDHDLTFDPASSLQKQNDPEALTDFRTPRFDLDCLYGRGPDDQPYLYAGDGVHLLLGRALTGNPHDAQTRDVPRNTPNPGDPARALLGDPRNDENVIISQLQSAFIRFHNHMTDFMTTQLGGRLPAFEEVQRAVRWHYQWMILNDFLPTIIGQEMVHTLLPHLKNGTSIQVDRPNLQFFKWKDSAFIPIEFTAAAYRFGHSMVRPIYRLNTTLPNRQDIFSSDPASSLVGFREFPSNWAIDWSLFFDLETKPETGPERVQKSYKIDTSLVNPLGHLPPSIGANIPSLAERNLLRGWRMGLPSGQTVARHIGVPVIPDAKLKVGKATEEDAGKNRSITELSPHFANNAPLWFYILAEAQQAFVDDSTPLRLGPVGGRIIGEVFVGLLLGDSHSFLSQDPTWEPFTEFQKDGKFHMAELLRQATH